MQHQLHLPHLDSSRLNDMAVAAKRLDPSLPQAEESLVIGPDGVVPVSAKANRLDELLNIREHERQRLAQDLHDSAGQLLVALELSVARLKRVDENCGHDGIIDEIQDTVRRIDQEVRSLAFLHYPVELGDRSLAAALRSLSLGFGRRTGIETAFEYAGDHSPLDEAVSMALLRVTQEALVNIHRHSKASAVEVVLEGQPGQLHLTISDNGVGFPPSERRPGADGIGLKGMRRRIEMLGGQFRIRNLKRGAKIAAMVPLS